jgi:hypothetical protein
MPDPGDRGRKGHGDDRLGGNLADDAKEYIGGLEEYRFADTSVPRRALVSLSRLQAGLIHGG